jgi:hypothetical protein
MGPSRGPSGIYNQGSMNSYKSGGPEHYRNEGKFNEGKNFTEGKVGNHYYNYGGREHGYDHNNIGHDHKGVVSGNFFEHGRHFHFRRFFNGQWVFLNTWDDCTAYAWVHVAPGVWAWTPVDVCVG